MREEFVSFAKSFSAEQGAFAAGMIDPLAGEVLVYLSR